MRGGDPVEKYEAIGQAIGHLVSEKQKQYGDSFGQAGQVMRVLYPQGISLDQLDSSLTVVRVIDKLFRVANGDQGGESAWMDIAGYAVLECGKVAMG